MSPIHIAIQKSNLEKCELLISRGADVNHADNNGTRPIHIAIEKGDLEKCELLISHGADINYEEKYDEYTPLALAVLYKKKELIKMLLSKGANISKDINEIFEDRPELQSILINWPKTMWIIMLQELFVFNFLNMDSFDDFQEFYQTENLAPNNE